MIEYLSSVIFDFDATRKLSEARHKDAFVDIFEKTLELIMKLFEGADTLRLRVAHPVSFASLILVSQNKEGLIYSISKLDFLKNLKEIATCLYYSENDSVVVHFVGYSFSGIVVMDPIYIAFSKNASDSDPFL